MTEDLTTNPNPQIVSVPIPQRAQAGPGARFIAVWRGNGLALVGVAFLALVVLGAVFAPILTSYSPTKVNVRERLKPPSLTYPMGTDELGRDIRTRILYGGRSILISSSLATLLALLIGTGLGVFAAYRGGWLGELLMRLMDIVLSFPAILLAILVVAALGPGLINLVLAITVAMVPVFARLARAIVLSIVEQDYVIAAKTLGLPDLVIIRSHVLPNMLPLVLVQATGMLAVAFATSSALNFLGLGVVPPTPDWGLMVAESQRLVFDAPHVPFFPGLVITLTVMAVNVLGDGLRDRLDPMGNTR
ncbi:MAG: ABC transporter permease [Roseiflexaceae bacterium]|nr:ABC transporter permease [Roseiflexaceae bacterium]